MSEVVQTARPVLENPNQAGRRGEWVPGGRRKVEVKESEIGTDSMQVDRNELRAKK